MTTQFADFIDITGVNAHRAPLVKGGLRAYYATGSSGIEETAGQILAARQGGMGIALYDQTASLSVFAVGIADIADIERGAGTIAEAVAAVERRQHHHWQSTLYTSFDALPGLKAAIKNTTGVRYGVADYSWSITEAQDLLNKNPDWAYCQYGDPASNPKTLVPGTHTTLAECEADINVGRASWVNQFLPKPPPASGGPFMHETDGTKSAEEIAQGRHESVLALLQNTARFYKEDDLKVLAGLKLPKGVRYYTLNP
jgi:hypothetical protein